MTLEELNSFTSFIVTGVLYRGGRFPAIHTTNFHYAMCINLWRGTVWGVLPNGRRRRIKQVCN